MVVWHELAERPAVEMANVNKTGITGKSCALRRTKGRNGAVISRDWRSYASKEDIQFHTTDKNYGMDIEIRPKCTIEGESSQDATDY